MTVADKPSDEPESKYTLLELHRQPKDHLAEGETWPEGRLADEAPGEARLVQELVKRLKAAMDGKGLKKIEKLSGVNKSSISRLLRGETWGTLPVIAGLEKALGEDLWGDEHRQVQSGRQLNEPDGATGRD